MEEGREEGEGEGERGRAEGEGREEGEREEESQFSSKELCFLLLRRTSLCGFDFCFVLVDQGLLLDFKRNIG